MNKIITGLALAASLLVAAPAFASGFTSETGPMFFCIQDHLITTDPACRWVRINEPHAWETVMKVWRMQTFGYYEVVRPTH